MESNIEKQENQGNQNNQRISQQPEESKPLSILKLGLEFLFVGIILIFFFAVLNYFNILSISSLFPSQLGWLPRRDVPTGTSPHKEVSNGTSQQSQQLSNVTIAPTISPSVSLLDPAKQTLTNFLPTILAPSILTKLPSSITLKEDEYNQGRLTTSFNTRDERMGLEFRTSIDLRKITSLDFSFEKIQTASPSVELGKATIPQIFSITPKGVWGCKALIKNKLLYCENFWQDVDTKRGLGFLIITDSLGERIVFSFCEHTKESDSYSWKSCRSELLKTGVR